jgi:hypothetical protein
VLASSSGTIFLTHYSVMHRRAASAWEGEPCIRNMLKYSYYRQSPPSMESWPRDPGFATYGP